MNTRFHWQWKSFWVSNIIRWLPQGDKVKIPAFIIYVRLEERQLYGLPLQRQLRPEGWAVSVYASHFEVEAGTAIVVLSENGTICHKSRLMTSGHSKVTGCTLLLSGQSLCHQEYVRDLVIMKKKKCSKWNKINVDPYTQSGKGCCIPCVFCWTFYKHAILVLFPIASTYNI